MEIHLKQYGVWRIESILRTEDQIVAKLDSVNKSVFETQKKSKNTRLEIENVKEETKLFPRILNEVEEITGQIAECCDKICLLDQILCEKIIFKYKDELVKYEQAEIRGLNEEERRLE